MRFLMLYPNQFALGNKPIGIASLAAMVKKAGHEFKLFDCTQFSIRTEDKSDWNQIGSKTLQFKNPANSERLPKRQSITFNELIEKALQAVEDFQPDIIGLSALTDDYPLGLGLMRKIKESFPYIPSIAGGIHATVDPQGVMAEDCFDAVCVGEGEYVILDIIERIVENKNLEGIGNLWLKKEDGTIEKNPVRPYEQNLDLFPYPDWTIYSQTAFYKPYLGHVYKYGDFEMSRGCPYKCSYCINVQLQEMYKMASPGGYHREKTIDRVIREIKYAVDVHKIEFMKFWDETFLLMDPKRMQEFCDKYSADIGLPYVIETTAQSITDFSAKILRKTNCKSVSLGMETGSPDMRKGLLHKTTSNEVYVKAFQLLKEHGVSGVSFNMIGLPNESQEDIFRTIALNKLVGSFTQKVGIFYPYKGTPIRDWMIQSGWMGEDYELKSLKNYNFNTFTFGNGTVVKFKDMDSRLMNRLWLLFAIYTYYPVKLFPLIDHVKNHDGEFSINLLNNLQRLTYYKKFNELPLEDEEVSSDTHKNGIQVVLKTLPKLQDEETDGFIRLLVQIWQGDGLTQLIELIDGLVSGELQPDFPIPQDRAELARWVEADLGEDESLRQVRSEMRELAKTGSEIYSA
jgi:anaerobic magnesium-protoporphyrin IX monomethyl ester cyclase